jgi:hypothetical protein
MSRDERHNPYSEIAGPRHQSLHKDANHGTPSNEREFDPLMANNGLPFNVSYSPNISLGHIIVAAPMLCGLVWWAATYAVNGNTNADALREMKSANATAQVATQTAINALDTKFTAQLTAVRADLTEKIVGIQAQNNEQFRGVRSDIANLPDVRASMEELKRRADGFDSRLDAQSKRNELTDRSEIETRSDLKNLASDVARLTAVTQSMQSRQK